MNFMPARNSTNRTERLFDKTPSFPTVRIRQAADDAAVRLADVVHPLVVAAILPETITDLNLPSSEAAVLRAWVSRLPSILPRWPALIDATVHLEIRIGRADMPSEAGIRYWSEVTASLVGAPNEDTKNSRRATAAAGFASVIRGSLQRLLDAQVASLAATGARRVTLTGIFKSRSSFNAPGMAAS